MQRDAVEAEVWVRVDWSTNAAGATITQQEASASLRRINGNAAAMGPESSTSSATPTRCAPALVSRSLRAWRAPSSESLSASAALPRQEGSAQGSVHKLKGVCVGASPQAPLLMRVYFGLMNLGSGRGVVLLEISLSAPLLAVFLRASDSPQSPTHDPASTFSSWRRYRGVAAVPRHCECIMIGPTRATEANSLRREWSPRAQQQPAHALALTQQHTSNVRQLQRHRRYATAVERAREGQGRAIPRPRTLASGTFDRGGVGRGARPLRMYDKNAVLAVRGGACAWPAAAWDGALPVPGTRKDSACAQDHPPMKARRGGSAASPARPTHALRVGDGDSADREARTSEASIGAVLGGWDSGGGSRVGRAPIQGQRSADESVFVSEGRPATPGSTPGCGCRRRGAGVVEMRRWAAFPTAGGRRCAWTEKGEIPSGAWTCGVSSACMSAHAGSWRCETSFKPSAPGACKAARERGPDCKHLLPACVGFGWAREGAHGARATSRPVPALGTAPAHLNPNPRLKCDTRRLVRVSRLEALLWMGGGVRHLGEKMQGVDRGPASVQNATQGMPRLGARTRRRTSRRRASNFLARSLVRGPVSARGAF
ncbi:hypothetical protein FB451DRAFT_1376814 [Mycena latifolia]|nr:hypothetical protein FB451DRAFT_1376814 [Mycena latifolia]